MRVIDLEDTHRETVLHWSTLRRPWYAWQSRSGSFLPKGPLAFSPDGRLLAAQARWLGPGPPDPHRNSVLLWEVASGREYLRLPHAHLAGFADDGTLCTVRHPSDDDRGQARLDLGKPERIRAALPEEALSLMQAPASCGALFMSWLLALIGLVYLGLGLLGALARAALGGYDVEGGWKGLLSFACMTVPGLVQIALGLYYVLTVFDFPDWSGSDWPTLAFAVALAGCSIIWGIQALRGELGAYRRELTGTDQGSGKGDRWLLALSVVLFVGPFLILVVGFIWKAVWTGVSFEWSDLWLFALLLLFALLVGGLALWLVRLRQAVTESGAVAERSDSSPPASYPTDGSG
jgi:hypothetical protein